MLPLLLTPTAWHQPVRRPASRRSCTTVPRTCAARMEGAYKVEVLPPIGDSSIPQKGKSAVLGEESVGIVFELVFRDIKMLSRTALQRPWPVVIELAQERLDMVAWFAKYKADQCNLRLHDEVARSLESLPAPRRVKSVLAWHRACLKTQLGHRRKDLWPTLRTLLQRPSMHERIVLAARSQALQFKQSSTPGQPPAGPAGDAAESALALARLLASVAVRAALAARGGGAAHLSLPRRLAAGADQVDRGGPSPRRRVRRWPPEPLPHPGPTPSPRALLPCALPHRRPVLCLRLQRRVEKIEDLQPYQASLPAQHAA